MDELYVRQKMTQFQLSSEEYTKANWRLSRKAFVIRMVITASILGICFAQVDEIPSKDLIAYGVLFIILMPFAKMLWNRRIRKVYEDEVSFRMQTTLDISEDGFKMENERGSSITLWNEVKKSIETSDFFLLFTSKKFARIIPKRVLTVEQLTLLTSKIKKV